MTLDFFKRLYLSSDAIYREEDLVHQHIIQFRKLFATKGNYTDNLIVLLSQLKYYIEYSPEESILDIQILVYLLESVLELKGILEICTTEEELR